MQVTTDLGRDSAKAPESAQVLGQCGRDGDRGGAFEHDGERGPAMATRTRSAHASIAALAATANRR